MAQDVLGISKKYLRFFVNNHGSRWVMLRGGRRSGKSFSVIKWLWFLASAKAGSIFYMCAASFPALQLLMNDFQRATPLKVEGSTIYGYQAVMSNGSKFIFKSFDTYEKTQGTTCDYLYLEEALNIPIDIITTLSMSVTQQIFACFNPTKKSGLERYVNKDQSNLLLTTWQDNEYLTDAQREEFEAIKRRALAPNASIMDKYAYEVYYKGNYAEMSGKVFQTIYTCTDDEFDRIPVRPLYGLDFGFVESRDMTALVAVKIHNNCVYAKELIYDNGNLINDKALAHRLSELGINEYEQVVADYGGLGKTRIHNLVTAGDGSWSDADICHGFNVMNAKKGKVVDGIQQILNYDKIFFTESSYNLRAEADGYELTPEGKAKGDDHALDAFRYAVMTWSIACWE